MTFLRSPRMFAFSLALLLGGVTAPSTHAQKGGASPAQSQGGGQQGGQGGATPYFETEMQAYGAANQLSESIAQQVCKNLGNNPTTVVIFDQSSFQNVLAWQSFSAYATSLKSAYETLLTDGEVKALFPRQSPQSPGRYSSLLNIPITGASDLAGLITALASSTTNTASTFTIQDSTMAVGIAHQFKRPNFQRKWKCNADLRYYPLFGSFVDVDLKESNQAVQDILNDLNRLRQYIQQSSTYTGGNTSTMSPKFSLLNDLNTQYDLLLKSILPNSSQGQGGQQGGGQQGGQQASGQNPSGSTPGSLNSGSTFVSLVQGAVLNKLLAQDNTYILYADVVAAGGTQRDMKNIFTLITGDWIFYSGGLVVNAALVHSTDTTLIFADTLRYRTGDARHISSPRESELIENTNAGENEDSVCGGEKRLPWYKWRKFVSNPCSISADASTLASAANPASISLTSASNGPLLPVRVSGKEGYIDRNGALAISPQFTRADDFSDGLAAVYVKGSDDLYPMAGYIKSDGSWAIKPMFDWAGPFHEGFARVKLRDSAGSHALVSSQGQVIPIPHGDYNGIDLGDIVDGLAVYSSDGAQYGFVDATGAVVINPRFEDADPFSEGLALVKSNGKFGFINKKGEFVIVPKYALATDFQGGHALVCIEQKQNCGSIDKTGSVVPSDNLLSFDRWGSGHNVNEPIESSGLHVMEGGRGYEDENGKVVIAPKYYRSWEFSDGLAAQTIDQSRRCGYIDKTGAMVIPPVFSDCDSFEKGVARISAFDQNQGVRTGYIDKMGKTIWLSK